MRRSTGALCASICGVALVALVFASGAAACGDPDPDAPAPPAEAGPPAETAPPEVDAGAPPFCVDGKPTVTYPPAPYGIDVTKVLPPDLAFGGPDGTVFLKDYFEPCAEKARILIVRTSTAWCGTCQWHVKHTAKLLGDPRFASRLLLLDLVVADRDNMPPSSEVAAQWKGLVGPQVIPSKVALDPRYVLAPVLEGFLPLPEYVFVDTKTMQVRTVTSDPDPAELTSKILIEIADLDRQPRPLPLLPTLYDDLFTENEWDLVQDMRLVATPPPDPTNEYGDSIDAAAFGKALFSDKLLTPSGAVACASCHEEGKIFTDGAAQSTGLARVDRNSPSVALAAHNRWQFWDGRADTLWAQALGPPENTKEMGSSRLFVAHRIEDAYAGTYDAIFGAKYPRPDLGGLPASGKPGDAAYDALPSVTKDSITRVYVNVAKSIAAFERSLRVQPNALDAYANGDKNALGGGEKQSLKAFLRVGCVQCHWGPRLTDDAFHALRFPTGKQDGTGDPGRFAVLTTLAASEFAATTKWSDAPTAAKPLVFTSAPSTMNGAFKTPSLRGVAQTAPFGHGGALAILNDVTRHYGSRAQLVPAGKAVGGVEAWVPSFDGNVQSQLPTILRAMRADVVP